MSSDGFLFSDQSKRFLELLDDLINKQEVYSDAEFCRKVDYSTQSFSQIRQGKRNINIPLLESAEKAYNIDIAYVISGKRASELAKGLDVNIRPGLRTDVRPEAKYKNETYNNEANEDGGTYKRVHELEAENERLKAANAALIEAFKAIGEGKANR